VLFYADLRCRFTGGGADSVFAFISEYVGIIVGLPRAVQKIRGTLKGGASSAILTS
jgi:hypothetical protein